MNRIRTKQWWRLWWKFMTGEVIAKRWIKAYTNKAWVLFEENDCYDKFNNLKANLLKLNVYSKNINLTIPTRWNIRTCWQKWGWKSTLLRCMNRLGRIYYSGSVKINGIQSKKTEIKKMRDERSSCKRKWNDFSTFSLPVKADVVPKWLRTVSIWKYSTKAEANRVLKKKPARVAVPKSRQTPGKWLTERDENAWVLLAKALAQIKGKPALCNACGPSENCEPYWILLQNLVS